MPGFAVPGFVAHPLLPLAWLALCMTAAFLPARASAPRRPVDMEHYRVTTWTSEHGLPQNTVNCLAQSDDGYLWVGTRYGLARYDGLRFKDFTAQLSEFGGEALDIQGIAQGREGPLWLLTGAGVFCYEAGRFDLQSLTNAPFQGRIDRIAPHPERGVWLATGTGVFQWHRDGLGAGMRLSPEIVGLAPDTRLSIDEVIPDGSNVWVKSTTAPMFAAWQRLDPGAGLVDTITNLLNDEALRIGGLCPDGDGCLWMARPGELVRWKHGVITHCDAGRAWGPGMVKRMLRDASGKLWILTYGGTDLHRFADGVLTSYGKADGLDYGEDLRCILSDREGNIWLGTGNAGLCLMQPRKLVSILKGSRSMRGEVYSIHQGKEGRVWMTTDEGVTLYQRGQFTVFPNEPVLHPENFLRVRIAFEHSSGDVFSAIDFEGLHSFKAGSFSPIECFELDPHCRRCITGMAEDAQGTLWMATVRGLAGYRDGRCRLWTTEDGLSENRTLGVICGADGSVWVGTDSRGVNVLRNGRFRNYTAREGILSRQTWPLMVESDGTAWVGTPVGLNRIRGDEVRSVTMRDGLFDNLAYCLIEDSRGNYWTFGNRGVWRVKKEQLHGVADGRAQRARCINYGEADGMASAEGNGDQQPNAALLDNGEIWFPTTRGVVVVDPAKVRDNSVPPPVAIEEVVADGQSVYRDGGFFPGQGVWERPRGRLHFAAGRARVLQIDFTSATMAESDKTTFRCRLEGNDSKWQEMDTRRTAVFTNLKPGNYRFEIEACNHYGYWSERPASFQFAVAPYFYQTWLFPAGCAASAGLCWWGWERHRRRTRRMLQRLQQDRAVEAERNRIARDLHDDLGARLTGLAVQIDVAVRETGHPDRAAQRLKSLSRESRSLVDVMREVVWSINPQCDSLESFCAYACQYVEKFARPAGLQCRFDVPEAPMSIALSAEVRHHLLLVIKEALTNTARHASASEVRLEIRADNKNITVIIIDNGVGCVKPCEPAQEGAGGPGRDPGQTGNGLKNMRQRVEMLGGEFEFKSGKGLGTSVRASVPASGPSARVYYAGN